MTLVSPLSLQALKLGSREELSPGERERQSPSSKAENGRAWRMALKNNSCFSLFERTMHREAMQLMVIFAAIKQVRDKHAFRQMCPLKALLRIYTAVKHV